MSFWTKLFGGAAAPPASEEAPPPAPAAAAPSPEEAAPAVPPVDAAARYDAGMAAWQAGDREAAEAHLRAAAEAAPDELRYVGNLGNLLQEAGDHAGALACQDRVLAIKPALAIAHHNRGNALLGLGRVGEARYAFARALELKPDHAGAAANLARLAWDQGDLDEAIDAWRAALAARPDDADALARLGTALLRVGEEAEAAPLLARAVALEPERTATRHNLGRAWMQLSRAADALPLFQALAEARPDDVDLRYDLATALKHLGRLPEALAAYAAAVALDPTHAGSRANLGWLQLQTGDEAGALETWAEAARVRQRTMTPDELRAVPRHRLRHDIEQVRYLEEHVGVSEPVSRWVESAEALLRGGDHEMDLSSLHLAGIAQRTLHLERSPRVAGGALRADLDAADVCRRYHASKPEVVVIDGLLSAEALAGLQEHARRSTMWARTYPGGYLGAFMGSGLANPLVLQVAEELRARLGPIFGEHQLEQCWAFKYDSRLRGINIHADVAAVNVNFWITPDAGCEDPKVGGLVVWDVESPKDWSFRDYNENEPKIRDFLRESGANPVRVPYRCNRAVVFNSTLFHETDDIRFRNRYEHRRVNLTMLFGVGLRQ